MDFCSFSPTTHRTTFTSVSKIATYPTRTNCSNSTGQLLEGIIVLQCPLRLRLVQAKYRSTLEILTLWPLSSSYWSFSEANTLPLTTPRSLLILPLNYLKDMALWSLPTKRRHTRRLLRPMASSSWAKCSRCQQLSWKPRKKRRKRVTKS